MVTLSLTSTMLAPPSGGQFWTALPDIGTICFRSAQRFQIFVIIKLRLNVDVSIVF